jgi:hypothetical protein
MVVPVASRFLARDFGRGTMNNGTGRAAMLVGAAMMIAMPFAAQAEEERYGYVNTSLFGEQEADGKGAGEDASADFGAEFDYKEGKMCYFLEMDGLKDFTAAHIHKGPIGEDGPPVLTLELSKDGQDVCVSADVAVMKEIAASPAEYYVNLHTKRFPDGAVRGQLASE